MTDEGRRHGMDRAGGQAKIGWGRVGRSKHGRGEDVILPGRGGREILAPRRVREPNKRKVEPGESGAPVREMEKDGSAAVCLVVAAVLYRRPPVGRRGERRTAVGFAASAQRCGTLSESNGVDPGEIRGW